MSKTRWERDASRDPHDIASREDLDEFRSGRRQKRRHKRRKALDNRKSIRLIAELSVRPRRHRRQKKESFPWQER